ncbi:MAG: hypothetical protein ABEJ07_00210 [Candidatus Nanohaloarchaea archaeon]
MSDRINRPVDLIAVPNSITNLVNRALDEEEGREYADDFMEEAISTASGEGRIFLSDGPVCLKAETDGETWQAYEGQRLYVDGERGQKVFSPLNQFEYFLKTDHLSVRDDYTEAVDTL